ncbi:MAG: membrane-bound O-acyltransferase family protein [Myxococcales bacterium]|nr:membrane-bound O-acyltransferase family protein [Myxococcales bacterium]
MLFSTFDYTLFLPAALLVYWLVRSRGRDGLTTLLGLSLLCYGLWNPLEVPLLVAVVVTAFYGGNWIQKGQGAGRTRRMWLLILLLFAPLAYYKYGTFILENLAGLIGLVGLDWGSIATGEAESESVRLPIGISFFTFQAVAYVVDVAKGMEVERSFKRFALFLSFFPQLVAGPIVRAQELLPQLKVPKLLRRDDVSEGLYRIAVGFIKKLLIADILGAQMVDSAFVDPSAFSSLELMIALYAYTLQIYCDFSGYTDIAIGSGLLFGIKLPENFRRPYKATSVAGFWRRWHITLSLWLRHYVYFPLGGSQRHTLVVYRNIFLTLIGIGLWHGADWAFVLYGVLHGAAVCVNRFLKRRGGPDPDDPLPNAWAWFWRFFLTFHFVVLARILFRAGELDLAWRFWDSLTNLTITPPRYRMTPWLVMLIGYAVHFSPDRLSSAVRNYFVRSPWWLQGLALLAIGVACSLMGTVKDQGFIYFEF